MSTFRRLVMILVAIWAAPGCTGPSLPTTESEPPRLVETMEVQPTSVIHHSVTLIGRTEPWRETTLYFEVPGVVAEVFVEEGDHVQAGRTIARLDLRDFELSLARAGAEYDVARAGLNLLEAGTRSEDLEAAKAELAQAQSSVEFWTSEYQRAEQLRRDHKSVMTTTEIHRIRQQYVAAKQGERIATAQLLKATAGPREEEIQGAKAEVEARKQAVALAQRQLEKGTLKAPFTGVIESRFADPGSYNSLFPQGGIPIVHLMNMQTVDAVVSVPEDQRSSYRSGDAIQIASATRPEIRATGQVISLARAADTASGTYALRIRVINDEGLFTGGMVVTAESKDSVASDEPKILIPLNAVRRAFAQPPYVLMVETEGTDEKVVAREVGLSAIRGDLVMVQSGLVGGERLIVRGQHLVVHGDFVRQRRSQPASVAKK